MPATGPLDLPTASALVRLRLLAEDARCRAEDASDAGRHLALVALDGACEYALWLASREHAVRVRERAGVPELYGAVKEALAGWEVRGWRGVSQMHQARNVAQHAGVALDADQLPSWAEATTAFIDSLCLAAFGTELAQISLADAVRDQSLRVQLRWSEEQLSENLGRCFSLAVGAFDEARRRWRAQRNALVPSPSPNGHARLPDFVEPLHDVDEFLEVQPFAGDFGEYMWLRRARQEHAFERPARSCCTAPEHQLRTTQAALRATDVYTSFLHRRLELAQRTGARAALGRLDGAALVRVAAVADALGSALEHALAQIADPELPT